MRGGNQSVLQEDPTNMILSVLQEDPTNTIPCCIQYFTLYMTSLFFTVFLICNYCHYSLSLQLKYGITTAKQLCT